MVVFRENTEAVYVGFEWPAGIPEAWGLVYLRDRLQTDLDARSPLGLKPAAEAGSKRLIKKATAFALNQGRRSVILVQEGNT